MWPHIHLTLTVCELCGKSPTTIDINPIRGEKLENYLPARPAAEDSRDPATLSTYPESKPSPRMALRAT